MPSSKTKGNKTFPQMEYSENYLQFQEKCKKVTKADPLPKRCRNNLTKNPTTTTQKFRKIKIITPFSNNSTK